MMSSSVFSTSPTLSSQDRSTSSSSSAVDKPTTNHRKRKRRKRKTSDLCTMTFLSSPGGVVHQISSGFARRFFCSSTATRIKRSKTSGKIVELAERRKTISGGPRPVNKIVFSSSATRGRGGAGVLVGKLRTTTTTNNDYRFSILLFLFVVNITLFCGNRIFVVHDQEIRRNNYNFCCHVATAVKVVQRENLDNKIEEAEEMQNEQAGRVEEKEQQQKTLKAQVATGEAKSGAASKESKRRTGRQSVGTGTTTDHADLFEVLEGLVNDHIAGLPDNPPIINSATLDEYIDQLGADKEDNMKAVLQATMATMDDRPDHDFHYYESASNNELDHIHDMTTPGDWANHYENHPQSNADTEEKIKTLYKASAPAGRHPIPSESLLSAGQSGSQSLIDRMVSTAGLPEPSSPIEEDNDVETYYKQLGSARNKAAFATMLNDWLDNLDPATYDGTPDVDVDPGLLPKTTKNGDQLFSVQEWSYLFLEKSPERREALFNDAVAHVQNGEVTGGAAQLNLYEYPTDSDFGVALEGMAVSAGLPAPDSNKPLDSPANVKEYYNTLLSSSAGRADAFATLLNDYLDNAYPHKYGGAGNDPDLDVDPSRILDADWSSWKDDWGDDSEMPGNEREEAFRAAVAHVEYGAVTPGPGHLNTVWSGSDVSDAGSVMMDSSFHNMIHGAGLPDPDTVPDVSGHTINSDADVENYYKHLTDSQKDAFETLLNDYLDRLNPSKYNGGPGSTDVDVDVDPGHLTGDRGDQWRDDWFPAWPSGSTEDQDRKALYNAAVAHVKDGKVADGAHPNLYENPTDFGVALDRMVHKAGLPDPSPQHLNSAASVRAYGNKLLDDAVTPEAKYNAFATLLNDYLDQADSDKYEGDPDIDVDPSHILAKDWTAWKTHFDESLHGHEGKQEQAFAHAVAHVHDGTVDNGKVDTAWNAGFRHVFNNMILESGLPDPDGVLDHDGKMINSNDDLKEYYNHLETIDGKAKFETLLNNYLDATDEARYKEGVDVDVDPAHLPGDFFDQLDHFTWDDSLPSRTKYDTVLKDLDTSKNLHHSIFESDDDHSVLKELGLELPGKYDDFWTHESSPKNNKIIDSNDDIQKYYEWLGQHPDPSGKHTGADKQDILEAFVNKYLEDAENSDVEGKKFDLGSIGERWNHQGSEHEATGKGHVDLNKVLEDHYFVRATKDSDGLDPVVDAATPAPVANLLGPPLRVFGKDHLTDDLHLGKVPETGIHGAIDTNDEIKTYYNSLDADDKIKFETYVNNFLDKTEPEVFGKAEKKDVDVSLALFEDDAYPDKLLKGHPEDSSIARPINWKHDFNDWKAVHLSAGNDAFKAETSHPNLGPPPVFSKEVLSDPGAMNLPWPTDDELLKKDITLPIDTNDEIQAYWEFLRGKDDTSGSPATHHADTFQSYVNNFLDQADPDTYAASPDDVDVDVSTIGEDDKVVGLGGEDQPENAEDFWTKKYTQWLDTDDDESGPHRDKLADLTTATGKASPGYLAKKDTDENLPPIELLSKEVLEDLGLPAPDHTAGEQHPAASGFIEGHDDIINSQTEAESYYDHLTDKEKLKLLTFVDPFLDEVTTTAAPPAVPAPPSALPDMPTGESWNSLIYSKTMTGQPDIADDFEETLNANFQSQNNFQSQHMPGIAANPAETAALVDEINKARAAGSALPKPDFGLFLTEEEWQDYVSNKMSDLTTEQAGDLHEVVKAHLRDDHTSWTDHELDTKLPERIDVFPLENLSDTEKTAYYEKLAKAIPDLKLEENAWKNKLGKLDNSADLHDFFLENFPSTPISAEEKEDFVRITEEHLGQNTQYFENAIPGDLRGHDGTDPFPLNEVEGQGLKAAIHDTAGKLPALGLNQQQQLTREDWLTYVKGLSSSQRAELTSMLPRIKGETLASGDQYSHLFDTSEIAGMTTGENFPKDWFPFDELANGSGASEEQIEFHKRLLDGLKDNGHILPANLDTKEQFFKFYHRLSPGDQDRLTENIEAYVKQVADPHPQPVDFEEIESGAQPPIDFSSDELRPDDSKNAALKNALTDLTEHVDKIPAWRKQLDLTYDREVDDKLRNLGLKVVADHPALAGAGAAGLTVAGAIAGNKKRAADRDVGPAFRMKDVSKVRRNKNKDEDHEEGGGDDDELDRDISTSTARTSSGTTSGGKNKKKKKKNTLGSAAAAAAASSMMQKTTRRSTWSSTSASSKLPESNQGDALAVAPPPSSVPAASTVRVHSSSSEDGHVDSRASTSLLEADEVEAHLPGTARNHPVSGTENEEQHLNPAPGQHQHEEVQVAEAGSSTTAPHVGEPDLPGAGPDERGKSRFLQQEEIAAAAKNEVATAKLTVAAPAEVVVQQRQAETAHVQVDAEREEAVPVEEDLTPATSFLLTTFSSTGAATVEEAPGGPSSSSPQDEKKNDSIFTQDSSPSSTSASPHERPSTPRTVTNLDGSTTSSGTSRTKKSNLRGGVRTQTSVTGTSRVAFLEDTATRPPRTEQEEKMKKRDEETAPDHDVGVSAGSFFSFLGRAGESILFNMGHGGRGERTASNTTGSGAGGRRDDKLPTDHIKSSRDGPAGVVHQIPSSTTRTSNVALEEGQEQDHVKNENQLVQPVPVENKKKFNLRGGAKKSLSTGGTITTSKISGSQPEQEDFVDEDLGEDVVLDHDQGGDSVETGSEEDEQAEEAERPGEELEEKDPADPPLHDEDADQSPPQEDQDDDAESSTGDESESDVAGEEAVDAAVVLLAATAPPRHQPSVPEEDEHEVQGTMQPAEDPPPSGLIGASTSTSTSKTLLDAADVVGRKIMRMSGATTSTTDEPGGAEVLAHPRKKRRSNLRGAAINMGDVVHEENRRLDRALTKNSTWSSTAASSSSATHEDNDSRRSGPGGVVSRLAPYFSAAYKNPAAFYDGPKTREHGVGNNSTVKEQRSGSRSELEGKKQTLNKSLEILKAGDLQDDEAQQPPEPSWTINHFYLLLFLPVLSLLLAGCVATTRIGVALFLVQRRERKMKAAVQQFSVTDESCERRDQERVLDEDNSDSDSSHDSPLRGPHDGGGRGNSKVGVAVLPEHDDVFEGRVEARGLLVDDEHQAPTEVQGQKPADEKLNSSTSSSRRPSSPTLSGSPITTARGYHASIDLRQEKLSITSTMLSNRENDRTASAARTEEVVDHPRCRGRGPPGREHLVHQQQQQEHDVFEGRVEARGYFVGEEQGAPTGLQGQKPADEKLTSSSSSSRRRPSSPTSPSCSPITSARRHHGSIDHSRQEKLSIMSTMSNQEDDQTASAARTPLRIENRREVVDHPRRGHPPRRKDLVHQQHQQETTACGNFPDQLLVPEMKLQAKTNTGSGPSPARNMSVEDGEVEEKPGTTGGGRSFTTTNPARGSAKMMNAASASAVDLPHEDSHVVSTGAGVAECLLPTYQL
ncbi:unnamed protein product [Amoebophrya sp. A120]|nr:unnamed protein product [Amoebophrya sp. A120]|eukprot:GSA120T00021113001.1